MQKIYITDKISESECHRWLDGKKIIFNAPTGTGKTTFICERILPLCQEKNKKALVLCNRRLLREQYGVDLATKYTRYAELCEVVEVRTYQEMAQKLEIESGIKNILEDFDVVIFDEVHFFYADSDFNGMGTYILLQELIRESYYKTVIMVTATLDEVLPLIEKTYSQCEKKLELECGRNRGVVLADYAYQRHIYNFDYLTDYSRFSCYFVEDVETLASEIAKSEKKSVIFIDDKTKAESFKKLLMEKGKLPTAEVFLLNANVLEENPGDRVIRTLTMANRVLPKVLITTSVLDNGVSIHDPDVGNIVLATESKLSFLQMIGRLRSESTENCRLYIYPRTTTYYEKRVQQYEERIRTYEKLAGEIKRIGSQEVSLLYRGWYGNDEKGEFLRNALILTKEETEYFSEEFQPIRIKGWGFLLTVNAFAMEKTGNLLHAMKEFLMLSYVDPKGVAIRQIAWIGKTEDELHYVESSYKKEREEELITALLEIKNFTHGQLRNKKNEISREFRKDLLSDIVTKTASFSTEKLKRICEQYQLELIEGSAEDKTKRYTVERKQ